MFWWKSYLINVKGAEVILANKLEFFYTIKSMLLLYGSVKLYRIVLCLLH